MRPERPFLAGFAALNSVAPARQSQRGFAAVAALFLIVLLAAMGGFMVTFGNTQQLTSAQDIQGTRAYWAARAGLEWGVGHIRLNDTCTQTPTLLSIDGFTVCVSCSARTYTEAASVPNVRLFQLESVARSPVLASCLAAGPVGRVGYVERSLSVSLEK